MKRKLPSRYTKWKLTTQFRRITQFQNVQTLTYHNRSPHIHTQLLMFAFLVNDILTNPAALTWKLPWFLHCNSLTSKFCWQSPFLNLSTFFHLLIQVTLITARILIQPSHWPLSFTFLRSFLNNSPLSLSSKEQFCPIHLKELKWSLNSNKHYKPCMTDSLFISMVISCYPLSQMELTGSLNGARFLFPSLGHSY